MRYLLLTNLEIILIAVVAVLIFSIVFYYYTGKTIIGFTIKRGNYFGRAIERKLKKLAKRFKINYDWWDKFPIELFNIQSYDGLELYARILRQETKTNKLAIVVHGFMNNYKDMQTYAKYFYDNGYNVLTVDNRAHGLSGGEYVGMGWFDRLDIVKWIDYVIQKFGKRVQIVLFGISMGGATVLMTSGEELPPNVKCIISDSAYDNVYNIFHHVMKNELKLPAFSLIRILEGYNKMYFGESIKEHDTISQVKKSKTPILIIHGKADNFVPVEMAYKIYDAILPELRDILIVPHAWHGEAQAKNTKQYNEKLEQWLGKYIK